MGLSRGVCHSMDCRQSPGEMEVGGGDREVEIQGSTCIHRIEADIETHLISWSGSLSIYGLVQSYEI